MNEFVMDGGGERFRIDMDGEGGVKITLQNLADPEDEVLHVPIRSELKNVIPIHQVTVFTQEQDQVGVSVEAGVEWFVIPEMQAKVQEGDLRGETLQLQTG